MILSFVSARQHRFHAGFFVGASMAAYCPKYVADLTA